jgi:hypothetical protein
MENVEKLERLVREASKSQTSAETLLKDPKFPYLSDLIETYRKAKDLPLRVNSTDAIATRINMAKDWLTRLGHFYLKPDGPLCNNTNSGGSLLAESSVNIAIIEVLTPRLDLKSLIAGAKPIEQPSSQEVVTVSSPSSTSLSKRQRRAKLGHHTTTDIETISDLYKDTDFVTLSEKYKALEIGELELVKQLRRVNTDKLAGVVSQVSGELAVVGDVVAVTAAAEATSRLNVRCCSCTRSMLASIYARTFQQCRLCRGVFHINCKNALSGKHDWHGLGRYSKYTECVDRDAYMLCQGCERSRRPRLDPVASMLVHFENLEVRAYEANALQMSFDRTLKWQERWRGVCAGDVVVRRLLDLARRYFAEKTVVPESMPGILAEISKLISFEIKNAFFSHTVLPNSRFSREFTNFHTFSRNLFFTCMNGKQS